MWRAMLSRATEYCSLLDWEDLLWSGVGDYDLVEADNRAGKNLTSAALTALMLKKWW